jgi:hypothetical protein
MTMTLALGLACPLSIHGADSADASGQLDLEGISLTPSSGSISWSGWALNSYSSSADSSGASDMMGPQSGSTATSASAAVPYATTSTSAGVSGSSALSGQISGAVALPSGPSASATVGNAGNYSSWENQQFSIVGASGLVSVSVSAMLQSSLAAFTDSMGSVLENDVIFNLNIDGQNVLTFYDSLTAGPDQNLSHPLSSSDPAGSITLDSSMTHDIFVSIDDEQEAVTVPEQTSSLVLLLVGIGALGLGRELGTFRTRNRSRKPGGVNLAGLNLA